MSNKNKTKKEFFDSGSARNISSDEEMLRASIAAELDAASLYKEYANKTSNEKIKKVMLDIAKEEEVHIGEFQEILNQLNSNYKQNVEEGENEVKQIIGENMKTENKKEAFQQGEITEEERDAMLNEEPELAAAIQEKVKNMFHEYTKPKKFTGITKKEQQDISQNKFNNKYDVEGLVNDNAEVKKFIKFAVDNNIINEGEIPNIMDDYNVLAAKMNAAFLQGWKPADKYKRV